MIHEHTREMIINIEVRINAMIGSRSVWAERLTRYWNDV